MGALFGKPKRKASRITDVDRAILSLKTQRDQLVQFRKQLELKYANAENSVKQFLKENRRTLALLALKSRNHYGDLVHQAESHLLQINQLISNVEISAIQKELVKAIESGNSVLKSMQAEISIGYVERLMEENAEVSGAVREVQELLGGGINLEDDSTVLNELERLQEQIAVEKIMDTPNVPIGGLIEKQEGAKNVSKVKSERRDNNELIQLAV